MFDGLPFPVIRGNTPEKKIEELTDFLMQFKEALEFALMNISEDNLSLQLKEKLDSLCKATEQMSRDREEELAQISKNTTTQGG